MTMRMMMMTKTTIVKKRTHPKKDTSHSTAKVSALPKTSTSWKMMMKKSQKKTIQKRKCWTAGIEIEEKRYKTLMKAAAVLACFI